jgi:hypothetical protein
VAVSPDGKTAGLGGLEGVPLRFWDLTEWTRRQPRTQGLSSRDLQKAWEGLAGEDAAAAYRALGTLIRAPEQAVPYLRERLRPVAPAGKQVRQWVADLDSDDFDARERATEELRKAGESAELALRQALEGGPSAEVRRRVEGLLKCTEASAAVRSVEVLEYIGTPEAKEVLQWLAQGVPQARLTQEAKASVERLERRAGRH